VRTDGAAVRRLARHRSRVHGACSYAPRAVLGAGGRFAVVNSNMGRQPFPDYTEVYLLDLGALPGLAP
jgi:hypothetical protein